MRNADIPAQVKEQLPSAIINNQSDTINNLLTTWGSNWIDSELPNSNYQYLLSIAAVHANIELFTLLVNTEAYVDVQDKEGRTPLLHAVTQNKIQHVELLLAQGASLILHNRNHWTPLYVAANKNLMEIAQLLVTSENASAQMINYPNTAGGTALMIASMHGYIEMINLLLDNGADINHQDRINWNALMKAADKGHADVVARLLERGADYTITDNNGFNPLTLAAKAGHSATVEIILQLEDINVDALDQKNRTALFYAVQRKHLDVVRVLVDAGANINEADINHTSPLMLAEQNHDDEILEILNSPRAAMRF